MAWNRLAPFEKSTGSLLHWARYIAADEQIDWRPQVAFEATLKMSNVHRYGHTFYFTFQDLGRPGAIYPVFCSGIQDIFAQTHRGRTEGFWLPVKRGSCYAVELVEKVV